MGSKRCRTQSGRCTPSNLGAVLTLPNPSASAARLAEMFERVVATHSDEGGDYLSNPAYAEYSRGCGFDSPAAVEFMLTWYQNMLCEEADFETSVGCDLGCWLGFSTAVLAELGPRKLHGVDVLPRAIARARDWLADEPDQRVDFCVIANGQIPLPTASVNWVVMNQVLCNQLPDSVAASLSEAHRILAPGGLLAIADTNNPHCPETLERLRTYYQLAEGGDGTDDSPLGPNAMERLALIREQLPELGDQQAELLARETCYLHTDGLQKAIADFAATGNTPGLRFEPESLKPTFFPRSGWCNGAITDPFEIADALAQLGFPSTSITCNALIRDLDREAQLQELTTSQGFFVFARK